MWGRRADHSRRERAGLLDQQPRLVRVPVPALPSGRVEAGRSAHRRPAGVVGRSPDRLAHAGRARRRARRRADQLRRPARVPLPAPAGGLAGPAGGRARRPRRSRLNLIVWIVPPVLAACAVALTVALRATTEEAGRLSRDRREFDSVRLAVVELRTEADRAREALTRSRLR